MSRQASFNSHDYMPVDIVPVIASFDSEGHIAPLLVRIEGNAYRIKSFWIKKSFSNTIAFNCQIIDNDCLKPLSLTYMQDESVWTTPRR